MPSIGYKDTLDYVQPHADDFREILDHLPKMGNITVNGFVIVEADTHPGFSSTVFIRHRGTVEIPGGITTFFPETKGAEVKIPKGSYIRTSFNYSIPARLAGSIFTGIGEGLRQAQVRAEEINIERGRQSNAALIMAVLATATQMQTEAVRVATKAKRLTKRATAKRTRIFGYSRAI